MKSSDISTLITNVGLDAHLQSESSLFTGVISSFFKFLVVFQNLKLIAKEFCFTKTFIKNQKKESLERTELFSLVTVLPFFF